MSNIVRLHPIQFYNFGDLNLPPGYTVLLNNNTSDIYAHVFLKTNINHDGDELIDIMAVLQHKDNGKAMVSAIIEHINTTKANYGQ